MHWPGHSGLECEILGYDRKSLIKSEATACWRGGAFEFQIVCLASTLPSAFLITKSLRSFPPSLPPPPALFFDRLCRNSWYCSQDFVVLNCFRFRVIDEEDEMWDFEN
ncbi:hypothetical protein CEXT_752451 [Caerostris extrusa]|uniref:Uncharacterized protein n=1 Tax=Caerostris extrusa TaxID=172846 RepID=A0AAV4X3Z1_CAEEX|nr:hypothetical protein CEXT_752451 [Caerostris extrusa]